MDDNDIIYIYTHNNGWCKLSVIGDLPSGNLTVRYWKWPIEIADLPFLKIVIFHSKLLVYQRVVVIVSWETPINGVCSIGKLI